jgi:predicted secreted protein
MGKTVSCLLVLSALLLGISAVGCNGGSTPASAAPTATVTVSLEPSGTQTMYEGQTLTVVATVNNDPSNKGVDWSLNGVGSLANQAANHVDYVAPGIVTSTTTVTITATSVADSRATAKLAITVGHSPALTISTTSLPNGSLTVPYATEISARGGVSPYTWSVSQGMLPSWASLDSASGIISGTPDAPGTSTFTIKVTDAQTSPASAAQTLSIAIAAPDTTNNAELKGPYAFLLQGFDDATGNQFAIVGSFTADGNGNVSGLEDINGPAAYQPEVTITGTYNLGADNRGTVNLSSSLGASNTFAIAVGSLNSSNVATRAGLIEFDDTDGKTGKHGSGFIYLQDPTTFNLSSINGPYALQFAGQTQNTDTRLVMTGAYKADGNGNLTNGVVDTNSSGVTTQEEPFRATMATDEKTASFGRVTATPTGIQFHFVYYIVSAERALAMSTDQESTAGLVGGEVLAQTSNSFSLASLQGTYVGYAVGLRGDAFVPVSVGAGLWIFNGSGSVYFSLDWIIYFFDLPNKGSLTYTVSPNGRVSTTGGDDSSPPGNPVFYLVDADEGFFMTTNNSTASGFFERQTGGPFSNASVSGNYFAGTVPPPDNSSAVASGVGTSPADGSLNLTLHTSNPTSFLGITNAVQTASLNLTIDSTGRGKYNQYSGVFYVVSPTKVVFLANPAAGWDTFPSAVVVLQK